MRPTNLEGSQVEKDSAKERENSKCRSVSFP